MENNNGDRDGENERVEIVYDCFINWLLVCKTLRDENKWAEENECLRDAFVYKGKP